MARSSVISSFIFLLAFLVSVSPASELDTEIQKRQTGSFGTGQFSFSLTSGGGGGITTSSPITTPSISSVPTTSVSGITTSVGGVTSASSSPSQTPSSAQSTQASSSHASTSSSRGELILATTDASGHSTTFYGAAASSYASSHRVSLYSSALVSVTHRPTVVLTTAVVDGRTSVSSYTTSTAVTHTTGTAVATNPAQLGQATSSSTNGLSSTNKKIIGGVIGGIAGAILIGGLLGVYWRLRRKKGKDLDYDEYAYSSGNVVTEHNRASSRGSNAAFTDGLERYNNPAVANAPPAHSSTNF